jgi:uncharacterized tellurite resistance protein B-like protein
MIKALASLFEHFQGSPRAAAQSNPLRLGIACLIHEAGRVDFDDDAREHPAAIDALKQMFGLETHEAEALLEEAHRKAQQLSSYYSIVSAIKRDLSPEQRVLLIEVLWRVAYADKALHAYEDHFVRKIAHLLYVPNTQTMLARSRARADAGLTLSST